MKNRFMLLSVIALLAGCGQQGVQLEKGSPEYELAQSLAEIVPYANPGDNPILIQSDNWKISSGEVIQHLFKTAGSRTEQLKRMDAARLDQILQNAAVGLAEKKLLIKAAEEKGIAATDQEVDSILTLNYNRFGGEEKFNAMVTQQGQDLVFIKKDIRERHQIDKYMQEVIVSEAAIGEEEIQEAYASPISATVRHILFLTRGKSDSECVEIRKKAEDVLKQAKDGKNFEKLVAEYSEDPGSKNKGGLYEDFKKGTMVKPFEEASFTLPLGSISDLVETEYGYHIIKVEGRKSEKRPLAEVKDQIRAELEKEKQREAYNQKLLMLKEAVHYDVIGF